MLLNMFVELCIEGLCFLIAVSVSMSCAAKKGEVVVVQEHPVLLEVYLFLCFMIAIAKRGFNLVLEGRFFVFVAVGLDWLESSCWLALFFSRFFFRTLYDYVVFLQSFQE